MLRAISLALLIGCGDDKTTGGGGLDSGRHDTGATDSGATDSGTADSGTADSGAGDSGGVAVEVTALGLVPLPQQITLGAGSFSLAETTVLRASGAAAPIAELLAASLQPATGFPLLVEDGAPAAGDISLSLDADGDFPDEGYALVVSADGVEIQAGDVAGLFYGTQTLRQLLPAEALSPSLQSGVDWRVPVLEIEDAPGYAWRGGMLDVARHFFDVQTVQRQIDLYALHKLNRLHLHLTDDQGWRIEILSWPDLALIGGSTQVGGGAGGFYTQEDYVGLVAYAAARQVVVVPEVDFPGHANAALASYGLLNASGEPEDLYTGEGVITTPLWLEGDDTWRMVEDVWTELAALTEGPYVHLGGDEAIDLSTDDYATFMQWLADVASDEDKQVVGWDEIGHAGLGPPFIAQYWWDEEHALSAASAGAELIFSHASDCYLDMMYDSAGAFGQTWAGYVDVQTAYGCVPSLSGAEADVFIGVEAPLWTEYVDSEDKIDFMTWPRLSAVAEVGWTDASRRDWSGFRTRLGEHGARLDAIGVAYNASDEIDWGE